MVPEEIFGRSSILNSLGIMKKFWCEFMKEFLKSIVKIPWKISGSCFGRGFSSSLTVPAQQSLVKIRVSLLQHYGTVDAVWLRFRKFPFECFSFLQRSFHVFLVCLLVFISLLLRNLLTVSNLDWLYRNREELLSYSPDIRGCSISDCVPWLFALVWKLTDDYVF